MRSTLYRPNMPVRQQGFTPLEPQGPILTSLYEKVVYALKVAMNKRTKDPLTIKPLNDVTRLFSQYWRTTGNYPNDNLAASFISDSIRVREEQIEKLNEKPNESNDTLLFSLQAEINTLREFLPANFEYTEYSFDEKNPSTTNVKWELHHNKRNVTIKDKRELRNL